MTQMCFGSAALPQARWIMQEHPGPVVDLDALSNLEPSGILLQATIETSWISRSFRVLLD